MSDSRRGATARRNTPQPPSSTNWSLSGFLEAATSPLFVRANPTTTSTKLVSLTAAGMKFLFLQKTKIRNWTPGYGRRVNSFVLVLVFHHTDTSLYLLSLALALSIHNKLKKLKKNKKRFIDS
jgi:hypothetical protein